MPGSSLVHTISENMIDDPKSSRSICKMSIYELLVSFFNIGRVK